MIVETKQLYEDMNKSKAYGEDEEESKVQEIDKEEQVNDRYIFWITTMTNPDYFKLVMRNSIKLICEPPKGFKSNMIWCYNIIENEYFQGIVYDSKSNALQKLFYSMNLIHIVLFERKRFISIESIIQ